MGVLTLVITPGGTRRVVTIAEALLLCGHDAHRWNERPTMTPEERRAHKRAQSRKYALQRRERQQAAEREAGR